MSTPELKPETPITDAALDQYWEQSARRGFTAGLAVMAETCRKLESALNAAREAIEKAPHTLTCAAKDFVGGPINSRCDCWKAAALAQIDEALSPQQSKTT